MREMLTAVAIAAVILIACALLGPICCERTATGNFENERLDIRPGPDVIFGVTAFGSIDTTALTATTPTVFSPNLLISYNQVYDALASDRRIYREIVLEMGKKIGETGTTPEAEAVAIKRIERCSTQVDYINGLLGRMADMAAYEWRDGGMSRMVPNPLKGD